MPALFLGTTSSLPPKPADQQFILLSEGLEQFNGPEHVPLSLCHFLVVIGCLIDDHRTAQQIVATHWREWAGTPITLELLSTDPRELQRHVRRGFRENEPGSIFLNGRTVAYRSSSQPATESARAVVFDSVFRKRWQLWQ